MLNVEIMHQKERSKILCDQATYFVYFGCSTTRHHGNYHNVLHPSIHVCCKRCAQLQLDIQ